MVRVLFFVYQRGTGDVGPCAYVLHQGSWVSPRFFGTQPGENRRSHSSRNTMNFALRRAGTPVAYWSHALIRSALVGLSLLSLVALALHATGCRPTSKTSRGTATLDPSGTSLLHVQAPGANQHWTMEVSLRDASEGTYALIFTRPEPVER